MQCRAAQYRAEPFRAAAAGGIDQRGNVRRGIVSSSAYRTKL